MWQRQIKCLFFGTPDFAADILTNLLQNQIEIAAVITKPDRPKGRSLHLTPTPVKLIALQHHLPLYQPEIASDPSFIETLASFQADLFIVVAYGEILKQAILDLPKIACINVHASLLPKYRGAAPIQRAIMAGETVSGVTIMHMAKKMDAGDIIHKEEIPISPNMTAGELELQLRKAGSSALLEALEKLVKGVAQRISQDPTQVTYAPKIELEECELNWTKPAQELHNQIRGTHPFPGSWCYLSIDDEIKRLKILSTEMELSQEGATFINSSQDSVERGKARSKRSGLNEEGMAKAMPDEEDRADEAAADRIPDEFMKVAQKGAPGTILSIDDKGLLIATGTVAIRVLLLQLEGKKAMRPIELFRGMKSGHWFLKGSTS